MLRCYPPGFKPLEDLRVELFSIEWLCIEIDFGYTILSFTNIDFLILQITCRFGVFWLLFQHWLLIIIAKFEVIFVITSDNLAHLVQLGFADLRNVGECFFCLWLLWEDLRLMWPMVCRVELFEGFEL